MRVSRRIPRGPAYIPIHPPARPSERAPWQQHTGGMHTRIASEEGASPPTVPAERGPSPFFSFSLSSSLFLDRREREREHARCAEILLLSRLSQLLYPALSLSVLLSFSLSLFLVFAITASSAADFCRTRFFRFSAGLKGVSLSLGLLLF